MFLLLSMITAAAVSVAAEDAEKAEILYEVPNGVASNQMDGKSEGWRNSKVDANKAPLERMELDEMEGLGATFSGAEANYFNTIRFLYYTATPLDLTEIKYVEFDLYISDATMYTTANDIMIELCSSGRQDSYEISTTIKPAIQEGWNHIKIKMDSLKNGSGAEIFDATAWNFFRLCINGPYDTGSDELTVAIANLTFWNGLNEDGLDEEEAKRQELLAKVQPTLDAINLFKDIKNKGDVTAENYATVKANVEAAYALYNALNEEEKALVTDEGGYKILKTAERMIEDYEKSNPPAEEKPEDENNNNNDTNNEGNTNEGANNNTEEPTKGCGGVLSVGAVATMVLAGAWVTIAARKKND